MNKTLNLIVMLTLALIAGCGCLYPGISGKVVDGLTGNPLEGAVVLAQWTKTHGLPGLTSHSVYKIEETETDKEGMFSLPGVYSSLVDPPEMVIYKKGYVPWRNDMNFNDPTWEHYAENIWQDNMTYKLELWKVGYSKKKLNSFLGVGIDVSGAVPKFQQIMMKALDDAYEEIHSNKNTK